GGIRRVGDADGPGDGLADGGDLRRDELGKRRLPGDRRGSRRSRPAARIPRYCGRLYLRRIGRHRRRDALRHDYVDVVIRNRREGAARRIAVLDGHDIFKLRTVCQPGVNRGGERHRGGVGPAPRAGEEDRGGEALIAGDLVLDAPRRCLRARADQRRVDLATHKGHGGGQDVDDLRRIAGQDRRVTLADVGDRDGVGRLARRGHNVHPVILCDDGLRELRRLYEQHGVHMEGELAVRAGAELRAPYAGRGVRNGVAGEVTLSRVELLHLIERRAPDALAGKIRRVVPRAAAGHRAQNDRWARVAVRAVTLHAGREVADQPDAVYLPINK